MATAKLDLFFLTPGGFDGHLELIPCEGESAITLMSMADKKLNELGCKPRPAPGKFGGKPKEPLPVNCPICNAALTVKDWTSKDGKNFRIWKCPADEQHYKKFVPVGGAA